MASAGIRRREPAWLSLGEASRLLGITASTLRRWADRGQVATFTTPGGHRRFSRAAIEALVPAARTRRPRLERLGASADRLTAVYRRARPVPSAATWAERLSEQERAHFRDLGHALLAALLRQLDADTPEEAAAVLVEAEAAARRYGETAQAHGVSLSETVESFLRFRQPFLAELAAIARRRALDTREATGLLMDAEATMDRLLMAVMQGAAS